MQGFAGDMRYALRQLVKTPAFSLAALFTLALGIGVNAAMFSVVDQALLRNVPYGDPSRLVLMGPRPANADSIGIAALPDVLDWRARSHSVNPIGYYSMQLPTLGGTGNPHLVPQVISSANLFDILGLRPALGRLFVPGDEQPGRGNVLVLSWPVWKNFFHGDPGIIGRAVPLNGVKYTVIGVLPAGQSFPEGAESMFSPLEIDAKDYQDRGSSFLQVIGRLRAGVSPRQAQAELQQIHQQLAKEYPDKESNSPVAVELYQDAVTEGARPALLALSGAVLAVWIIACANVAGLMLTRANSRRREIAIRGALGAGRSRLMRQFLVESLLLSLGGGLLGLGIAGFALKLLSHYLGNAVRHGEDMHIDVAVCAYLLIASCLSALLFGVIPGWQASRIPAQEGLREGSAAAGASRRQTLWRDSLVVGEIALTLALLVAGGLMLRTLWALRHSRLGFVAQHLVTTTFFLPQTHGQFWLNTDDKQQSVVTSFYTPLLERLRATPGMEMAALSTKRALDTSFHGNMSIQMVGMPKPPKGQEAQASVQAVSRDYFQTFGIPLLQGRFFESSDRPGQPSAVIVNHAFVERILPGKQPLGMQIDLRDHDDPKDHTPPATIVGVVADSRQDAVGDTVGPELEFDLEQLAPGDVMYSILAAYHMDLTVRTRLAPAVALEIISKEIHALQPEMALQDSKSMQQVIDDSLGNQTLAARLLSIFGVAALAIAMAGIYGLLSYSVSQRTRELGVRMALGAQRGDVLWLVLRHACLLLAVGVAIGIGISWVTGGVLRSFLFGLHPYDAATVLAVAGVLGGCGIAASYLPARRAASTDPMEALRTE
jgi:predicted permease